MKTQIKLPSFHGFYESVWSMMIDNEFEWTAQEHNLAEIDGWGMVDRKGYEQEICERYADITIGEMNSVLGLHLERGAVEVWSPREYNFATDCIYVDVEVSDEDIDRIVHLMLSDYNRLQGDIHDRHTSRSGFISFMNNDIDAWLRIFNTDRDNEDFGLYLGYALFYLWDPDDWDYEVYDIVTGCVSCDIEPQTDAAKEEWEKVQIAEEYLGWGGYDPDKMAPYSPKGLKFRLEKQKWEAEHLLGIEFVY